MLYINFWSERFYVNFHGRPYFLFYGSITCMNTTTQLIISCVLHSLQFAKNIFELTLNSWKKSHYILDH